MSQAGSFVQNGAGPIPPQVPTTFVTDVNSPAIPVLNILNVFGGQSSDNTDSGIQTDGSSGGDVLTIQNTNRLTGTVTTANATPTTIITFPLGATPGTFYVWGNVQAFDGATPAGGAFSYSGGYRTDGAAAVELGKEFHDDFKSVTFTNADINLDVSGNDVILQVEGVAATSINWNAIMEYRQVN